MDPKPARTSLKSSKGSMKKRSRSISTKAPKPNKMMTIASTRKYKTVGRTIKQGDKSYELMFDMLLGIRISVSGVSAKKKAATISHSDVTEVCNYVVPRYGALFISP